MSRTPRLKPIVTTPITRASSRSKISGPIIDVRFRGGLAVLDATEGPPQSSGGEAAGDVLEFELARNVADVLTGPQDLVHAVRANERVDHLVVRAAGRVAAPRRYVVELRSDRVETVELADLQVVDDIVHHAVE